MTSWIPQVSDTRDQRPAAVPTAHPIPVPNVEYLDLGNRGMITIIINTIMKCTLPLIQFHSPYSGSKRKPPPHGGSLKGSKRT